MEIKNSAIIAFILGTLGIILLPLGGIWAVNTLFSQSIGYTFINWLAAMFLQLYGQVILKAAVIGVTPSKK